MPQLDKNTFNYQLIVVLVLFASLFLVIVWVAFSITFSRISTRYQMDLTTTDAFKELSNKGARLLVFKEFLMHSRSSLAKKNTVQETETDYFKKSLYFFIMTSLMAGNYRYALIMDKTLVYILQEY